MLCIIISWRCWWHLMFHSRQVWQACDLQLFFCRAELRLLKEQQVWGNNEWVRRIHYRQENEKERIKTSQNWCQTPKSKTILMSWHAILISLMLENVTFFSSPAKQPICGNVLLWPTIWTPLIKSVRKKQVIRCRETDKDDKEDKWKEMEPEGGICSC